MVKKYKLESPVPIKNANGEIIPGKYKLMCYPFDRGSARFEAVTTFENITRFGESTSLPQPGTEFLGVQLGEKVYILKYVSNLNTAALEHTKENPLFYKTASPDNPGDWSMRMGPMSFIQFLTSGAIKLRASAETFINMTPDLATFSKLMDKIEIGARNLSMKLFGGSMEWLNYTLDQDFVSQLKLMIRKGNPLSELKSKNNHIELKAGSLVGDKKGILDFDVIVTDEDTGDTVTHKFHIGSDKITMNTVFPKDSVVYSKEITKKKITETTTLKDPDDSSKVQELKSEHTFLDSTYTTKIKQNTVSLKITSEGTVMESSKDVTLNSSKMVTVNSPKVLIKGGKLTVDGSVAPTGKGPFNAIPVCPFTGAPHIGDIVSGT